MRLSYYVWKSLFFHFFMVYFFHFWYLNESGFWNFTHSNYFTYFEIWSVISFAWTWADNIIYVVSCGTKMCLLFKAQKTSKIKLFGKIVSSLITFFCGMFHLGCLVGFWLHLWSLLHSFIQQSQNIKQSQNNFCACANLANKVFEVCNAENLFHGPKHLCQSLFSNKVTGLRPAKLLKKGLWHKCFPVNFAKFLRTFFLQNT